MKFNERVLRTTHDFRLTTRAYPFDLRLDLTIFKTRVLSEDQSLHPA